MISEFMSVFQCACLSDSTSFLNREREHKHYMQNIFSMSIKISVFLFWLFSLSEETTIQQNVNTEVLYNMNRLVESHGVNLSNICHPTMESKLPAGVPSGIYLTFEKVHRHFIDDRKPGNQFSNDTYDNLVGLFQKQNAFMESSLIFRKDKMCIPLSSLGHKKLEYPTASLVVNFWLYPKLLCKEICLYIELIFPTPVETLAFGLEMDQATFSCFQQFCKHILTKIQVLVFNVRFVDINTQLSYRAFVRQMRINKVDTAIAAITGIEFYLKFNIELSSAIDPQKENIVHYYIQSFANHWLKDKTNAKLIMPYGTIPKVVPKNLQNVYPFLYPFSDNLLQGFCELTKIFQKVGSSFQKVYVDARETSNALKILATDKCQQIVKANLKPLTKLSENVSDTNGNRNLEEDNRVQTLQSLPCVTFASSLHNKTLPVSNNATSFPNARFTEIIIEEHIFKNKLCQGSYENVIPFNMPSHPLFQFPTIYDGGIELWKNMLKASLNETTWHQNNVTGSKRTVQLHLKQDKSQLDNQTEYHLQRNLFCSDVLANIQETHESILLWAQINGFNVITYPILSTQTELGFWQSLVTDSKLNRTLTDFPVLVRRVPIELLEFNPNKLPFTYPCISAADKVTPEQFKILEYSGISINLDLPRSAPLSAKELQNLIFVALSRFQNLEIIAKPESELDAIVDAVNIKRVQSLVNQTNNWKQSSVLIELPNEQYSQNSKTTTYTYKVDHQNLGLSESEFQKPLLDGSTWNPVISYDIERSGKKVEGITIPNCIDEINSNITNLRNLKMLNMVSNLVCITEGKLVFNLEEQKLDLQVYFDTHLYIHRYFKEFLKKETIFRITFTNTSCNGNSTVTEAYLRFLSVANQFAETYKIKYFLGDAFTNCSWWQVDDYNDLLNHLTYTERISGQKPSRFTEGDIIIKTHNIALIIGLSISSMAILSFSCGIWVYYRRRVAKLLTKAEVTAFFNGEVIESHQETAGVNMIQLHTVKSLGFNKEFNVKKKHIEIGEMVGKGNFGQVYKGTLYGNQTVAIKIPVPDCSKEEFTTLLAEVKVLSYIGVHENVLRFVGAYVKQIDVGIIYVITEFCENGTLETYLRKKKPVPTRKNGRAGSDSDSEYEGYTNRSAILGHAVYTTIHSCVDLKELARFSYEIASGMEYISDKKVVHSDLSARNVLLNSNGTCKVGDFGLSRKLYENSAYIKKGNEAMPWKWMAVESLNSLEFTSKSDVWSFGITLWEIYSLGKIPYPGVTFDSNFTQHLEDGLRMTKPEFACDEIYETIQDCWNLSPESRPLFSELRTYFKNLAYPTE